IDERAAAAAERARMDAEAARAREEEDWLRARQVNTTASYRRYLQAYPEGLHAEDARRILREARARADADTWAEARRLDTPASYSNYLDLFPTGEKAVEAQRRYDALTEADAAASATAALRKEEEAWRAAEAKNTAPAYRDFAAAYPDSRFAAEATARREAFQTERRERLEDELGLNQASWKSIEQRLAFLGFDPGRPDGKVNKATRRAITQYRRSRGLIAHGYANKKFVNTLVKESDEARQNDSPEGLRRLLQIIGE
ncbi:MAG: peptidoglycan-binding domain-containing protein, partial [Pseudomonadota bacterium]